LWQARFDKFAASNRQRLNKLRLAARRQIYVIGDVHGCTEKAGNEA
jgi:hypothetical protein